MQLAATNALEKIGGLKVVSIFAQSYLAAPEKKYGAKRIKKEFDQRMEVLGDTTSPDQEKMNDFLEEFNKISK